MPRPTPQVSIRTEGANLCIALPPHGQLITLLVHNCLGSLCRAEDYGAFEPWQGKSFAWDKHAGLEPATYRSRNDCSAN